jgi:hypothetical protein
VSSAGGATQKLYAILAILTELHAMKSRTMCTFSSKMDIQSYQLAKDKHLEYTTFYFQAAFVAFDTLFQQPLQITKCGPLSIQLET